MNRTTLKTTLRNLAQNHCLILSTHCKRRMEKRNVTSEDILHVLMWGDLSEIQKQNENQEIKCKLTGKDIEGDRLTLQVAVCEKNNSVICITVY